MSRIERIWAREVLDSRGQPTVRAEMYLHGGAAGVATVPSGASTGTFEAFELRDGDEKRYGGAGVQEAVRNVREKIAVALLNKDAAKQAELDHIMIELDGTPNKKKLGANAILAVSLALARAQAASEGLPLYLYLQQLLPKRTAAVLPRPQMNVINGGKHARNDLSVQEFQLIPLTPTTFSEALRMGVEIYHTLRRILDEAGVPVGLGDEGGFAGGPRQARGEHGGPLHRTEHALEFLLRAIEQAGYAPGIDVGLGLDVAASELYDVTAEVYRIDGETLSADELAERYEEWLGRYPVISIEDPFAEEAWGDWRALTAARGERCQIIGDDLFVTNLARIQKGVQQQAATAVLIKPNQIGTLTETLQAIQATHAAGWQAVISHRSGETVDTFIADLAVAVGADQIKTGAPARSERVEKYNRLLEIEERSPTPLSAGLAPLAEQLGKQYQGVGGIVYNKR